MTALANVVVQVKPPTAELQALYTLVPDATFWHLRDTTGAIFGSHRKEWLARTQVKGVGDVSGQGMKVGKPNSSQRFTAKSIAFFYKVFPKSKTRGKKKLSDISAETYTHSKAALGQEFGGTFRSRRSRFLAIPIGVTRRADGRVKGVWSTPAKFKRGKRKKNVIALPLSQVMQGPSQQRGGRPALALFWRKGRGKRARLIPAFLLVKQVTLKPKLRYLATWDAMESNRDSRYRKMMVSIVADLATGRRRR